IGVPFLVEFRNFLLIGREMLLQHIVQVAIQREFVLTDNLHYPGYTLVKLLADIHRFAASGIGGGVPDKKTLVILAFPSSAAYRLFRSRRGGCLAGRFRWSRCLLHFFLRVRI